jgi:hypothetical protein
MNSEGEIPRCFILSINSIMNTIYKHITEPVNKYCSIEFMDGLTRSLSIRLPQPTIIDKRNELLAKRRRQNS